MAVGRLGAMAAACAASWIGLPGPGESLLIAAGVRAGEHRLNLLAVVFAAWLGALGGAIGGWLLGKAVGRRPFTASGPLFRLRQRMLINGDRIFERHPVLAILWAPAPMAGIHHIGTARYLAVSIAASGVWAAVIAVGAYFVGPTIVHAVDAGGATAVVGLMLLFAGSIAGQRLRRRRQLRRKSGSPATEQEGY